MDNKKYFEECYNNAIAISRGAMGTDCGDTADIRILTIENLGSPLFEFRVLLNTKTWKPKEFKLISRTFKASPNTYDELSDMFCMAMEMPNNDFFSIKKLGD